MADTIVLTEIAGSAPAYAFFRHAQMINLLNLRPDVNPDDGEAPDFTNEDRDDLKRVLTELLKRKPAPTVSCDPQHAWLLVQWLYHVDVTVSGWIPDYRVNNLTVAVVWDEVKKMLPACLDCPSLGRSWVDIRLALLRDLYSHKVDLIILDYTSHSNNAPGRYGDVAEWLYVRSWLLLLTDSRHRAVSLIEQLQNHLGMTELGPKLIAAIDSTDHPLEAMNKFFSFVEEAWDKASKGKASADPTETFYEEGWLANTSSNFDPSRLKPVCKTRGQTATSAQPSNSGSDDRLSTLISASRLAGATAEQIMERLGSGRCGGCGEGHRVFECPVYLKAKSDAKKKKRVASAMREVEWKRGATAGVYNTCKV